MGRELELGPHALAVALKRGDALDVRGGLVDHLRRAVREQADLVGGPAGRADAPGAAQVVALPVGGHHAREAHERPHEPGAEEGEKDREAGHVDGAGHGERGRHLGEDGGVDARRGDRDLDDPGRRADRAGGRVGAVEAPVRGPVKRRGRLSRLEGLPEAVVLRAGPLELVAQEGNVAGGDRLVARDARGHHHRRLRLGVGGEDHRLGEVEGVLHAVDPIEDEVVVVGDVDAVVGLLEPVQLVEHLVLRLVGRGVEGLDAGVVGVEASWKARTWSSQVISGLTTSGMSSHSATSSAGSEPDSDSESPE